MSQQTLTEFRNFVLRTPSAAERLKGKMETQAFAQEAEKIAKENGYALSAGEIAAAMESTSGAPQGELNSAQLSAVVGGGVPNTWTKTKCFTFYGHCI